MEAIDYTIPDPAATPYRNHALRAGLYIAAVSVFLSLILYLTGLNEDMLKSSALRWLNNLVSFGLTFWFIYSACLRHRNEDLGGYISVGRCLGIGFGSGLVAGLISGLWTLVFMNFIAPELIDQIKDMTMQQLADRGLNEEQIEKQMEMIKIFFTPGVFFISAALMSSLFGFLGGLVSGFLVKKERPYA